MQRATQLAGLAFAVTLAGDLERVGIDFDDRAQAWAGAVDGRDAGQVTRGQLVCCQLAGAHGLPLCVDARFEDGGWRRFRWCSMRQHACAGNGTGYRAGHAHSYKIPALHACVLRQMAKQ